MTTLHPNIEISGPLPIRIWRQVRAVGRKKLAFYAGLSESRLSDLERGYRFATDDERRRVAVALGVAESDIEWPDPNSRRLTSVG